MSVYAQNFRKDADDLDVIAADTFKKVKVRLRNAADVMDRQAALRAAARDLADEVEHVLSHGEIGKQSRRRLKSALRAYRSVA